ncbi:MAG TPA: carbohydrate binding domain-containing protein, partial [Sedimentisphaerales bacterium]|nr:carbohydrate binding domain-containing protein [Sedimentisphaerales bacterium]
ADTLVLYVRGNAPDFAETAGGQIIMSAVGTDIWNTTDQFRYAYKSLSGDGSMTVRVDSLVRSNEWAKAGVMIRETLEPGSKHAFMCVTPDHGTTFQRRPVAGQASASTDVGGAAAPRWVRLTRTGNVFTAHDSIDGVTWTEAVVSPALTIEMAANVYVGLAVTSHDGVIVTAAEFSNLSATGNVTGAWQVAEIGAAQPQGNSAESMYVTIEDSAGKSATVVNADASITQRATWQEWAIPYGELSGVNLSRVEKMVIGVGSATAPKAGGTGTVYIDDIGYGRPAPEPAYVNLLANGGFEDGVMAPWSTYGDVTAEVVSEGATEGESCLHITVNSAGANFWDAGLQHTGHAFEAGKQYTLSAFLRCSAGTLDINFKPELAADPWTGFGDQIFTMTNEWAEFSVTTPVLEANVSPAAITFHIAFAAAEFWIDGVRFYEGQYVAP